MDMCKAHRHPTESFFEFARSHRGNTSSLEHIRAIFEHQARMEQRPWCMTKREYRAELLRRQGQLKPGESEYFPCRPCRDAGHFCPATVIGVEYAGESPEFWCRACEAARKCVPGTGKLDMGGTVKSRKRRNAPCRA